MTDENAESPNASENAGLEESLSRAPASNAEPLSLSDVLVEHPPGSRRALQNANVTRTGRGGWSVQIPTIRLHCSEPSCAGIRFFGPDSGDNLLNEGYNRAWITYTCRDCRRGKRVFALVFNVVKDGEITVAKVGEIPAFGPPLPSRLLSLVGPDKDYFLRGRRAESQGMGVGAYAYYRRVVENQKNRLLDEAIRVGKILEVDKAIIQKLEQAKSETQFSKAMEDVKDAVPDVLRIKGLNPFTLLHHALSRGVHEMTDDECLQVAGDIRVVLAELADRMSSALKDDRELAGAVTRLNQLRSGQSPRE